MATISQLKQKAREWERQEQWKPALDAYEQMTREANGGEELDVGVWNRIGDLHMRLAQPQEAVSAYERAADAYADAGLHNNAIALCNKILRTAPDNPPILLKLAQISALKGFAADARQCVARYVAHARSRGGMDAAVELLVGTAEKQPSDSAELRFVVAETLQADGRTEPALALFREAHRILLESGDHARAATIQAHIRSLAPADEKTSCGEAAPEVVERAGTPAPRGAHPMPLLQQPAITSPLARAEQAEVPAAPRDAHEPVEDDLGCHGALPLLAMKPVAAATSPEPQVGRWAVAAEPHHAELDGLLATGWDGADAGASTAREEDAVEPLPLLGLMSAEAA